MGGAAAAAVAAEAAAGAALVGEAVLRGQSGLSAGRAQRAGARALPRQEEPHGTQKETRAALLPLRRHRIGRGTR